MTEVQATSTPTPDEATITALEIDCALAFIESPQASTSTLAASLDLHPAKLLKILARPHVIQWAEAALAVEHTRDHLLARRAHSTGLQTLAEVARDTQRDPVERRRAATAILRATQSPRPRASAQGAAADQPSPLAALKQLENAPPAPPAGEPPEPDCTEILKSIPATLARASTADPDSFKPIQQRCARPLRETTLTDFLARTQLHRAAGARLTEHHLFETGRGMQATFETDHGDVTFSIICHNFGIAAERWRITEVTTNEPDPDPEDEHHPEDEPSVDDVAELDPQFLQNLVKALQFTGAPHLAGHTDGAPHPARPP